MRLMLLFSMLFMFQWGHSQSKLNYPLLDSLDKRGKINLARYKGDKFLLVNVNPSDTTYRQYNELIALSARVSNCQVIVFPSENSPSDIAQLFKVFHNEIRSKNLIIASPQAVNGTKANSIYRWLSSQTSNGQISLNCNKPFYKVLIGRDGRLEAVFGPSMKCNDMSIFKAINQ
jgi:glutathione peroxidase-family protein